MGPLAGARGVSVLVAEGLRKRFGANEAVAGVSLAVEPGEMLALIGPNGAGKSTCFNMLGGQLRPDAGEVRLADRVVTGLAPRHLAHLGVGRTFQITASFASMTVRENVQTALLAQKRQAWRFWQAADAQHVGLAEGLLARVGMASQAERPAGVLAYFSMAYLARMTRAFMLDALAGEYVITARAKGLSPARVIWRHAFGNIAVRLITVLTLTYASLLEGAVVTETVFSWHGLGQYLTVSLLNADMNAVLGATLVVGMIYLALNLMADMLYRLLDPRVAA